MVPFDIPPGRPGEARRYFASHKSVNPFGRRLGIMDLFAHLASGGLLGRSFRPTGDKWVPFAVFGAVAAISPDVDAPLALLGPEVWAKYHQLFTHSLVGLVLVPLALSLIPFRFAPWQTRYVLALAGWSLHVFLDVCANWGVPVLWPISRDRWALHLLDSDFSWRIDMLLIVGLASTLWEPATGYARTISIATAILLAIWFISGLPT